MTLDSEQGRALAERSASSRKKVTLEDAESLLGALDTPQDAKRWLRQAFLWAAAEKVSGAAGTAMVGAVREWLKAHAEEVDAEQIKRLEQRIKELEAELRQSGRRA